MPNRRSLNRKGRLEKREEKEELKEEKEEGESEKRKEEVESEDIILYTGKKKEITGLGSECLGCVLLDSGCSKNVCGNDWWNSY